MKNEVEDVGRTPLYKAACKGHVDVDGLLLVSAIQGGDLNICKLLIEESKVYVNLSGNDGMTPLHIAGNLGQHGIFKFLCKYALDQKTLDDCGKTPIDYLFSSNL